MDNRLIPTMLAELSFLEFTAQQTGDERLKAIITKSTNFLADILEGKLIITEEDDE